jgi:uncharacterized membrane protein YciS (DUF1049 family)
MRLNIVELEKDGKVKQVCYLTQSDLLTILSIVFCIGLTTGVIIETALYFGLVL